jgi:hypothetical protein
MPRLAVGTLIVLWLAFAAVAAAAEGQQPDDADRGAIVTVISRQIDAFRRDDGSAAFGFASPSIQSMFGTPENFMQMVRRSYRPVYRPRDVRFEELLEHDGQLLQRVVLVGPEAEVVVALYEMQRQPSGEWRINGCFLLQAPERAT